MSEKERGGGEKRCRERYVLPLTPKGSNRTLLGKFSTLGAHAKQKYNYNTILRITLKYDFKNISYSFKPLD
jgi:hypothetical protein